MKTIFESEEILKCGDLPGEATRAHRMESVGILAGGVANDLNNLLTPIMLSIGLLKGMVQDSYGQEILATIDASIHRSADLVDEVLTGVRGPDGEPMEIRPRHLIQDIEYLVRNTFPKNIRVKLLEPSPSWTIQGDVLQLHRALLNLCVNAREAMPGGGVLTLALGNHPLSARDLAAHPQCRPGPYLRIDVIDSGTGIPQDVIDEIFDPFSTQEPGKGGGLSKVHTIVESHHGFLSIFSEAGEGTTFQIYLPANPAPKAVKQAQALQILPRGRGETVLVVEDDSAVRSVARHTLEIFGYRVLAASHGVEAAALCARSAEAIAIALVDMTKPGVEGAALIQHLKKTDPTVRIIAAGGLKDQAVLVQMARLGVSHFLAKPYVTEALVMEIHSALQSA